MSGIPSLDVAADDQDQEWTVESEEHEADRDDKARNVSKPEDVGSEDRGEHGSEQNGPENWTGRDPSRSLVWWPIDAL